MSSHAPMFIKDCQGPPQELTLTSSVALCRLRFQCLSRNDSSQCSTWYRTAQDFSSSSSPIKSRRPAQT